MRLILVGPPGAGKGTQAQVVAGHFGVPKISTGDIFRANVGEQTSLGVQAKRYLDAGDLVPDEITNAMVRDRLHEDDAAVGFLLDGFPRNVAQAEFLDGVLAETGAALDAAVELVADHEEIVRRLAGRSAQESRSDDSEDVIRHRLDVYTQQTAPLVGFYAGRGQLVTVDGMGEIEKVTERVIVALTDLAAR